MRSIVVAVCALAAALVHADTPAPNNFIGTWTGTVSQSFALANPTVADSYECLSGAVTITRAANVTITANTFARSALPLKTVTIGGGVYTAPAQAEQTFTWAAIGTDNILQLRSTTTNNVECFYAVQTGSSFTFLTLGGLPASNDFMLQCQASSYEMYANYRTAPFCSTPPTGGAAAYNSTTLESYTAVTSATTTPSATPSNGSPSPALQSSGSATMLVSVAAAMGALAATAASL